MKIKSKSVTIILLVLSSIIIISFFYSNIEKKNAYASKIVFLERSIDSLLFQQIYLSELFENNIHENNKYHSFDNIFFYKINDEKKLSPSPISKFFKSGKPKLVIRYTEIGCNSCSDSTFNILKMNMNLSNEYEIVVFVDFSNYDSYLKWSKVSEIPFPVFWVNKGTFPFAIEKGTSSYIFSITNDLIVNNLFIPNSKFPDYIKKYFESLSQ